MKNLFILLLTIISVLQINAQQSYTEMIDSIFQYVSRDNATTGILYERVLPFSAFHRFAGNRSDTASYERFIQSYSELYNAAFDSTKRLSFSVDSLSKTIIENTSLIDIALFHYKFNTLFDFL